MQKRTQPHTNIRTQPNHTATLSRARKHTHTHARTRTCIPLPQQEGDPAGRQCGVHHGHRAEHRRQRLLARRDVRWPGVDAQVGQLGRTQHQQPVSVTHTHTLRDRGQSCPTTQRERETKTGLLQAGCGTDTDTAKAYVCAFAWACVRHSLCLCGRRAWGGGAAGRAWYERERWAQLTMTTDQIAASAGVANVRSSTHLGTKTERERGAQGSAPARQTPHAPSPHSP
jgi:hypothetical protein